MNTFIGDPRGRAFRGPEQDKEIAKIHKTAVLLQKYPNLIGPQSKLSKKIQADILSALVDEFNEGLKWDK